MKHILTLVLSLWALTSNGAASKPFVIQGKDVLTGKIHQFSTEKTVVVFVSAICPCSNSHIKEIGELAKAYPDYRFVGVHSNLEEDEATTQEYFSNAQLPFPVLQDEGQKIATHYKALKTPHSFVHDEKGAIVYRGGVSDSTDCSPGGRMYLREALADLKNQRPVKTPTARILGCAISR